MFTLLTAVLNQREEAEKKKPLVISSQKELCELIVITVLEPTSALGLPLRYRVHTFTSVWGSILIQEEKIKNH